MLERKISLRYAKSLIQIAKNREEIENIKNELKNLLKIFEDNNLWKIFGYPKISLREKKEIIEKIPLTQNIKNFIFVLLEKKRINLLPVILEEYSHLSEEYLGIAKCEIISAVKLTEEEKKLIKDKVEKILNKKITIEEKIDKEILGGIIVKAGNTLIDGSLKGILNKLREELIK
jgi:F-type H+-transporting ATPase subunit delta